MNAFFPLAAFLLLISSLTQAARVSLPNGELTEQEQDLSVKVLGGTVSLDRTWTNGRWYFNPAWSNLKFKRNLEEEVQYVDRAGTVYERTGNQGDVYVFDDNQFIRRIVSSTRIVSWRWYNRSGASVNYDVDGLMQGYANRNGVKVSFVRGTGGRIDQVNDHFGNLALKLTYTGNKITGVQDRLSRSVTDVLGYAWADGYDSNGQLNKITDPELQITNISYVTSYPAAGIAAPLGISLSGRPGRDFRLSRVGILCAIEFHQENNARW